VVHSKPKNQSTTTQEEYEFPKWGKEPMTVGSFLNLEKKLRECNFFIL